MSKRAGEIEVTNLKNGGKALSRYVERLVELRDIESVVKKEIKETTEIITPIMLNLKYGTVIFDKCKLELYEGDKTSSFSKDDLKAELRLKGFTKEEAEALIEKCTKRGVKDPYVKLV